MEKMLWDGPFVLLRTLVIGTLAYAGLIALLRVSGKRTLSKLNAFDLIVTVALGSTLASILVTKDVALAQGLTAFGLLIGLQFAITWSSVRWHWVRRLVSGEPALLVHDGVVLEHALLRSRVTHDELHAALRADGVGTPAAARSVVLETDGSFTVLRRENEDRRRTAATSSP